ncbi:MAG: hypothetical protein JNL05_03660 [Flavobacteriales bacterium]|nr:hypothetical protein [Flavobacteriales bacterium]
MKPVKSTPEFLAFKALNRDIDKAWVDWAVEMLTAGFETENLVILAGESGPFNQFRMQELVDRALAELGLDYSDKDQIIKNYACYLIDRSLDGELNSIEVLATLKDIYFEMGYVRYLRDFHDLYYAKDDLSDAGHQWYWNGATRDNIDTVIADYFRNWQATCGKGDNDITLNSPNR